MPERPWSLSGRATIDAEHYRVRGRFHLSVSESGDVVLDFTGTTLFGGHREDVVVSLAGDTLRVFDRERARLVEGAAVDTLIREGTGVDGDWKGAIGRVAGVDACEKLRVLELDGAGAAGALISGAFRLVTAGGKLERAEWPDPTRASTFSDRLEVRYRWRGDGLAGIEASLPVRGWRVRLEGDA